MDDVVVINNNFFQTFFLLIFVFSFPIQLKAEVKEALVIGNSNYSFSPLKNPINDAKSISVELKKLNYNIYTVYDASIDKIKGAIDGFCEKSKKNSGVYLFYYAGHAFQIEGKNFIIPIDFSAVEEKSVYDQSICVDEIVEKLSLNVLNTNIVILDACRTSPYDKDENNYVGKDRAIRSLTNAFSRNGLSPMKGSSGTFIAFSTSPGRPAFDGKGDNGLYTKYLLKYLTARHLTIEEIFKKVRISVLEESERQQIPWERSSLLSDFYFIPPSKEVLAKKNVRELLQEVRIDVDARRYGLAYKRLMLLNKMAQSEDDIEQIHHLIKVLRKELRVEN